MSILVVGAGGLGCEICKNLSEFELTVVDMDIIELTNLNRQHFFSEEDIGKYKAAVIGEKLKCRFLTCRVETLNLDFYKQFDVVVCGLDSVEARRFVNAKIIELYQLFNLKVPLIDGGSSKFRGQCRVILAMQTACYECTLDLLVNDKVEYPVCTLASIPRLPEHCVMYFAMQGETDAKKVYELAFERASKFGIEGVTLELVHGVLHGIVPSIASTNAIIAGMCSLEAIKILKNQPTIQNYIMYTGDDGVFSEIINFKRNPECSVCANELKTVNIDGKTLHDLLIEMKESLNLKTLPSVTGSRGTYYMDGPPPLKKLTLKNLDKPINELIHDEILVLTSPDLNTPIKIKLA